MTPRNQGWKVKVTNDASSPTVVSGTVNALEGLSIPTHDYVAMTYSGNNLTGVVYKIGGSGGTAVATLAITYDGSNNLTSITKS